MFQKQIRLAWFSVDCVAGFLADFVSRPARKEYTYPVLTLKFYG